jgi:hypothetical protein
MSVSSRLSRPILIALLAVSVPLLWPVSLEGRGGDDPPPPGPAIAAEPGAAGATVVAARELERRKWLYGGFASLQALDVHSTRRAIARGGREANPVLRGVADRPIALVAVKTGITAATVYATERLAKTRPRTALGLLIAENVVYAMVVARNYRLGSRLQAR